MSQELEDWKLKIQITTGAVSAEATPLDVSPGFSSKTK
jgi:hypothetical protein